jgi:hypothetical protein
MNVAEPQVTNDADISIIYKYVALAFRSTVIKGPAISLTSFVRVAGHEDPDWKNNVSQILGNELYGGIRVVNPCPIGSANIGA